MSSTGRGRIPTGYLIPCTSCPNALFSTMKSWADHTHQEHDVVWQCVVCDKSSKQYDIYRSHIVNSRHFHPDNKVDFLLVHGATGARLEFRAPRRGNGTTQVQTASRGGRNRNIEPVHTAQREQEEYDDDEDELLDQRHRTQEPVVGRRIKRSHSSPPAPIIKREPSPLNLNRIVVEISDDEDFQVISRPRNWPGSNSRNETPRKAPTTAARKVASAPATRGKRRQDLPASPLARDRRASDFGSATTTGNKLKKSQKQTFQQVSAQQNARRHQQVQKELRAPTPKRSKLLDVDHSELEIRRMENAAREMKVRAEKMEIDAMEMRLAMRDGKGKRN